MTAALTDPAARVAEAEQRCRQTDTVLRDLVRAYVLRDVVAMQALAERLPS